MHCVHNSNIFPLSPFSVYLKSYFKLPKNPVYPTKSLKSCSDYFNLLKSFKDIILLLVISVGTPDKWHRAKHRVLFYPKLPQNLRCMDTDHSQKYRL